jgi:hypothetical protein
MATRVSFGSLFQQDNGGTLGGFTFQNEAMKAALEKAKEAKTQKVAEQAASLFASIDTNNNALLQELRRVRKLEKAAKDKLDKFKEAVEHFANTGNFGPLYPFMPCEIQRICGYLGVDIPTADEQKIPS